MITTASQVIEQNGGPAKFAEKVGVPAGRVRVWKTRNFIPRRNWPDVSRAFPDLTTEELLRIEAAA